MTAMLPEITSDCEEIAEMINEESDETITAAEVSAMINQWLSPILEEARQQEDRRVTLTDEQLRKREYYVFDLIVPPRAAATPKFALEGSAHEALEDLLLNYDGGELGLAHYRSHDGTVTIRIKGRSRSRKRK